MGNPVHRSAVGRGQWRYSNADIRSDLDPFYPFYHAFHNLNAPYDMLDFGPMPIGC